MGKQLIGQHFLAAAPILSELSLQRLARLVPALGNRLRESAILTLQDKKRYVTNGHCIIQLGQAIMSTETTTAGELNALATSLRQQLGECRQGRAAKGRRRAANPVQTEQLHEQVSALLDLVDELSIVEAAAVEAPLSDVNVPDVLQQVQAANDLAASRLLESLDDNLAQWQAQVTQAYAQGASRELGEQLQQAQQIAAALQQREERLQADRHKLEQTTARALQQHARTTRQRKAIAQTLRAQKAEWLLDVQAQRQTLLEQVRQEFLLTVEVDESPAQMSPEDAQRLADLEQQLQTSQQQLVELRKELTETQTLMQDLENAECQRANEGKALVLELEAQLAETQQELAHSQQLLCESAREAADDAELAALVHSQSGTIDDLRKRLIRTEQELQDRLEQNSDLAAQVAKHQVVTSGHTPHVNFDQQSLSWEERKKLIMLQLEEESVETGGDSPRQIQSRLEIEAVLTTTATEIDKRDAEIAELQAIIEHQSDTRQGVAIGAAAFAQAFDADEVIQQERQKLKEIQLEWEGKLRQAEIDVSLERAKLARERIELEHQLEATERDRDTVARQAEPSRKRKWLEHLGLKDTSRNED